MIRDARWKLTYAEAMRPMLFDMENDPDELHDLGASTAAEPAAARERLTNALFDWARQHHNRITLTPERIEAMTGGEPPGILIGFWDEDDLAAHGMPYHGVDERQQNPP